MRYHYRSGVIAPFVKKHHGSLSVAVSATFVLLQIVVVAGPSRAAAVEFDQQQVSGQISGLIYHDQNNNGAQDAGEPALQGWTAWLLTHDSPYTLVADYTTGSDGTFLFQQLDPDTYYVCQDLQDGWLQTQLAALGTGLPTVPVGTDLGDSLEFDALVAEFCYQVDLSVEVPTDDGSVFGNFFDEEKNPENPGGQVRGETTGTPNSDQVLAASTGQVLAATGQSAYWPVLLGILLLAGSLATIPMTRQK